LSNPSSKTYDPFASFDRVGQNIHNPLDPFVTKFDNYGKIDPPKSSDTDSIHPDKVQIHYKECYCIDQINPHYRHYPDSYVKSKLKSVQDGSCVPVLSILFDELDISVQTKLRNKYRVFPVKMDCPKEVHCPEYISICPSDSSKSIVKFTKYANLEHADFASLYNKTYTLGTEITDIASKHIYSLHFSTQLLLGNPKVYAKPMIVPFLVFKRSLLALSKIEPFKNNKQFINASVLFLDTFPLGSFQITFNSNAIELKSFIENDLYASTAGSFWLCKFLIIMATKMDFKKACTPNGIPYLKPCVNPEYIDDINSTMNNFISFVGKEFNLNV
jgi:hypothetical protein